MEFLEFMHLPFCNLAFQSELECCDWQVERSVPEIIRMILFQSGLNIALTTLCCCLEQGWCQWELVDLPGQISM